MTELNLHRAGGRLVSCLLGLSLAAAGGGAMAAPPPAARATPSGLPVPRYVSLKFDKVNARRGPGDDYPMLWVYRAKGLPLQVTAETEEWRRVCDPEGSLAWVHRRTLDARRSVMNTRPAAVAMRRAPSENAPLAAELVGRAVAELKDCKGDWCRVSVGRASGWVRQGDVWGVVDRPQCTRR